MDPIGIDIPTAGDLLVIAADSALWDGNLVSASVLLS